MTTEERIKILAEAGDITQERVRFIWEQSRAAALEESAGILEQARIMFNAAKNMKASNHQFDQLGYRDAWDKQDNAMKAMFRLLALADADGKGKDT